MRDRSHHGRSVLQAGRARLVRRVACSRYSVSMNRCRPMLTEYREHATRKLPRLANRSTLDRQPAATLHHPTVVIRSDSEEIRPGGALPPRQVGASMPRKDHFLEQPGRRPLDRGPPGIPRHPLALRRGGVGGHRRGQDGGPTDRPVAPARPQVLLGRADQAFDASRSPRPARRSPGGSWRRPPSIPPRSANRRNSSESPRPGSARPSRRSSSSRSGNRRSSKRSSNSTPGSPGSRTSPGPTSPGPRSSSAGSSTPSTLTHARPRRRESPSSGGKASPRSPPTPPGRIRGGGNRAPG